MLTVCCSSTDVDLTTTGNLKSLLNTTSTAQDAYLGTLIRMASRWAESYLGYPLTVQSYSETVAGFGNFRLRLERTPLRSVDRVMDATDTGTATQILSSEFTVDDAEAAMLIRPEGWSWTALGMAGDFNAAIPLTLTPMSGQETKPWLVDYKAGWTYNGIESSSVNYSTAKGTTSTGRTLPEDIELAVMYRAQAFYEGGDDASSESLGDISVNYRSLGTDKDGRLITRASDLLMPYVRFK